jgi:Cd2+/Zn2+-exporting ATPase
MHAAARARESTPKKPTSTMMPQMAPTKNGLEDDAANICCRCDSRSPVPPVLTVTRVRVSNMCCAGEERIIRSTLAHLRGIDKIDVNIIGRYAVIKHCNVFCCAPNTRIVELLNEKKLGASISESVDDDDDSLSGSADSLWTTDIAYCGCVLILFLIGQVMHHFYIASPTGSYLLFGCVAVGVLPVCQRASMSLRRRIIDIHVLMLIAIVGAAFSGDYVDAALLVTLFTAAEAAEDIVLAKVRKAVKLSTGTLPKKATLQDGKRVDASLLKLHDVICIRAGEVILADGPVTKGEAVVDESALTGEVCPVSKKAGDRVSSGTILQSGYVEITVDTEYEDRTIQKLCQAVMDVQADKGSIGRLVDGFALYWTPLVLVMALSVFCIGGYSTGNWHRFLHKSLVLLVLACPCALVVAAPVPSVCAVAVAARNGVLIRGTGSLINLSKILMREAVGSSVMERIGEITLLAADKTGTLTKGHFVVNAR